MTPRKHDRPSQKLCETCGGLFAPKNYTQRFCSVKCSSVHHSARDGINTCGPCPTCGQMFKSKTKTKIFCNMDCYQQSDRMKEQLRRYREAMVPYVHSPRVCQSCGEEFPRSKRSKYCSTLCMRKYMAARFDRWIANPETISKMQNFDEFLSGDKLTCPVVDCGWEGENLGCHVNLAHGITARDFKKLCGFNLTTGLIGADLSQQFSERTKGNVEIGLLSKSYSTSDSRDNYRSAESVEHHKKASALMPRHNGQTVKCRQCQKEIEQTQNGNRRYCSTSCRNKHYQGRRIVECLCSNCGESFKGSSSQSKRHTAGRTVVCSMACRGKMNSRNRTTRTT